MEVEAAIEAVGDGAEVALGVFVEAEGMIGTAEAAFEIAEDRVHPMEHGQLLGFAPTNNRRLVCATCVGNASKTGQAIGEDGAARAQRNAGPFGNRLACEAGKLRELGTQRVSFLVERDRSDEGHLVLRAAPCGAIVELTAEGQTSSTWTSPHST